MYEYYIYSQISCKEFGKANNYISLYNSLIDVLCSTIQGIKLRENGGTI